jgi:hypothetical protein
MESNSTGDQDKWVCKNEACSRYNQLHRYDELYEPEGIVRNPGFNCPECDQPLNRHFVREARDSLGPPSDSIGRET